MDTAVATGGSVRSLRTKGWASAPYAPTPPDRRTDEEVCKLIDSTLTRWRAHPSLPPMPVLLAVYREAWKHHKGPRRRRKTPNLFPDKWALQEVGRVCEVWVSGRRDHTGAWQQYEHIADFANRIIHDGVPEPVVTPPAPPAAEVAAEPSTTEPEKKLHWKVRQKMEREAAAAAAAPPPPPPPRMSPEQRAKARAEAILRAGGTARVVD